MSCLIIVGRESAIELIMSHPGIVCMSVIRYVVDQRHLSLNGNSYAGHRITTLLGSKCRRAPLMPRVLPDISIARGPIAESLCLGPVAEGGREEGGERGGWIGGEWRVY